MATNHYILTTCHLLPGSTTGISAPRGEGEGAGRKEEKENLKCVLAKRVKN